MRDTRTMVILFLLPIVLIVLFGFAITTEVKNVRLTVVDQSHDDITARIVERFAANRYFTISSMVSSVDEATAELDAARTDMVLVLPAGMADDMLHGGEVSVQLLVDGSEPNQAATRVAYAQQVLAVMGQEILAERAGAMATTYNIVPEVHMLYNPQQRSEYNFVPGIIGMVLMLICAMMTSIAIVREKETGTMEVLLASPLRPLTIILSKLVPYFVISTIDLGIILLLARFLLGMPFAGNIPMFLGVSLLYIFVALALGLLISTLVSSQLAAMLLSLLLVIPVLYFSGMAFPIESMAPVFQRVSMVLPARWYVSAVRKLMVQGVAVRYVVQETIVLAVMAFTLITVSLLSFKKRL